MTGKEDKVHGTPVSKEDVIAALGKPSAEWSRRTRKYAKELYLVRGETELRIRALKACGRHDGYIAFLERELTCPAGTGTGLVSEEENASIYLEAVRETEAELQECRDRLALLERSPDDLRRYLGELRSWVEFKQKMMGLVTSESIGDEIVDKLNRELREDDLADIAAHSAEIVRCEALIVQLKVSES